MEEPKNIASWLTVTKNANNTYSWSVEDNSGRTGRSTAVTVSTVTPPTHSAITTFSQSGESPFVSILSLNPKMLDASAGSFNIVCNTNLASVDLLISQSTGRDYLDLTYGGASGQPGVNITGMGLLPSGNVEGFRLTFDNDPGATSAFQFFVTYSYTANSSGGYLSNNIYFVTGSETLTYQIVSQSATIK